MPESWPGHPSAWSESLDFAGPQTNTTLKTAPPAGRRLVLTWLALSNDDIKGSMSLLDGSGGSVKFKIYPAINGGATLDNLNIKLTAATLLAFTSTDVGNHAVNVGGHSEPV